MAQRVNMNLQKAKWWVVHNAVAALPMLAAPLFVGAQQFFGQGVTSCSEFLRFLRNIANFGGGIVLTVAIIVFLIGAFYLLFGGGSEEAPKKGRNYVLYGAIGIVVAILAFSLPDLVKSIAGIELPICAR